MVRIAVHVTPKSGCDEVVGWRGDELWVRVTVAPEGGKANAAVERLIAASLGVPKSSATVVRGHTARIKTIEIDGVDIEAVHDALGSPGPTLF